MNIDADRGNRVSLARTKDTKVESFSQIYNPSFELVHPEYQQRGFGMYLLADLEEAQKVTWIVDVSVVRGVRSIFA